MTAPTLASRVARFQTAVVALALCVVLAVTTLVVERLLTWKTDQHLESVLERVAAYLPGTARGEPDWHWLAGEVQEVRPDDVRFEVRDAGGRLRLGEGPGSIRAEHAGGCFTHGGLRTCTRRHTGLSLAAGRDASLDRGVVWQLSGALAVTCVAVGVLVALGSGVITRRALNPLSALASRVRSVEPGTGQRVHAATGLAELDGVSRRFDELIARFEAALAREKRFSAEASHELRTPLTLLRAEIEELFADSRAEPERAASTLASVDRLAALVDVLLWFARAQGRLDPERLEIVNVADVVRAEVEAFRRVAPEKACELVLPDEALVRGDEELLRRAVANLLDNAFKHGDGAGVRVELEQHGARLVLSVANGGAPIPLEWKEQIFQPFFRPPQRAPNAPGFGLGLPFARAVARSHGGDIVHDSRAGSGVVMRLDLPLVEWNAA